MNDQEFEAWARSILPQMFLRGEEGPEIIKAIRTPGSVCSIIFKLGEAYAKRRTLSDMR